MLSDILRETDAYQQVLQEGLQEGLREGQIQTLQQSILGVIKGRLPDLVTLVQTRLAGNNDAAALSDLLIKISVLPLEEARKLVIDFGTAK